MSDQDKRILGEDDNADPVYCIRCGQLTAQHVGDRHITPEGHRLGNNDFIVLADYVCEDCGMDFALEVNDQDEDDDPNWTNRTGFVPEGDDQGDDPGAGWDDQTGLFIGDYPTDE